MKRKELDTIIKKIQNRCYLEEPTKITYLRLRDTEEIAFKVYFESLYIPENLRVGSEKLQNSFSSFNCYEYTDDFRILELNQDEGYIEFVPDCQKFNIVDSYKDSEELEAKDVKIKNESLKTVLLAGEKLNEAFAKSKKYILKEADEVVGDPTIEKLKVAKETAENDGKELVEKDAFVISAYCALAKNTLDVFKRALELIPTLKSSDRKAAVFLTIPKIDGKLYSSILNASADYFSKAVEKVVGHETYAALAVEENPHCKQVLDKIDVKNIYYLTTSAKQGIKESNLTKLLSATEQPVNDIVDDTETKETFTQAIAIVEEHIKGQKERLKNNKAPKSAKHWEALNEEYDKIKDTPLTKSALAIYHDLFGKGEIELCREIAKKRQEIAATTAKSVKNPASEAELITIKDKIKAATSTFVQDLKQGSLESVTSQLNRKNNGYENQEKSTFLGVSLQGGKGWSASSEAKDTQVGSSKETKTVAFDTIDLDKDFIFKYSSKLQKLMSKNKDTSKDTEKSQNEEKAENSNSESQVEYTEAYKKLTELLSADANFGEDVPSPNEESKESEEENKEETTSEETSENSDTENKETSEQTDAATNDAPDTGGTTEAPAEAKAESVQKLSESARLRKIFFLA